MEPLTLGLTLLVLIVGWFWWNFFSKFRSQRSSKLRRHATVKGKRIDPDGTYHIGFEFMDNQTPQRKSYNVPVDDYMFLQEGNEVDVYFKDGNYHSFENN